MSASVPVPDIALRGGHIPTARSIPWAQAVARVRSSTWQPSQENCCREGDLSAGHRDQGDLITDRG
ncbi:hypothetical protein UI24_10165 [Mycobacteroides franklinii]|nr:hypothetical protein [Mycobacteroides franklinii]